MELSGCLGQYTASALQFYLVISLICYELLAKGCDGCYIMGTSWR